MINAGWYYSKLDLINTIGNWLELFRAVPEFPLKDPLLNLFLS